MNKNYGMFGFGKQTAAGAVAVPTVSVQASADSDGIDVSTSTEAIKLTNGRRDTTVGRRISGSEASAKLTTLGFADFAGLMLVAALGKDTVTGEAAPYTHDITMGETLPYLTYLQQVGASDAALQQLADCKLNSLSISAEGTKPPAFEVELKGCAATWLAATAWSGPAFSVEAGYFRTTDAEVLFSLVDGEPVTVPVTVNLTNVSFKIDNAVDATTALGEIAPSAQTEKSATVTAEVTGTTENTDLYRATKTGSVSGTDVASAIVIGSLQVKFKHTKEDWELVFKLGAIPWKINAMGVSPDGGPFALTLSTDGAISVDGTSIECILQNNVASY